MEPIFSPDFQATDKNAWRLRLEKELKGRAYEDVLHQVAEHITVEPYYTVAELAELPLCKEILASQKQQPGWLTVPVVHFQTASETNGSIRRHLERGADGIWLAEGGSSFSHPDLAKTLHTVRLTDTPVFLDTSESAPEIIKELAQGSSYYLKGGLVHDPLAAWMRTGQDYKGTFDAIAEGMALTKAMREFYSYKVESHVFHEAGANVAQELAFTLAAFVAHLDELTERGISPLLAATRFLFSISVGTKYLTEIAKLRALRYLYRKITRSYRLPGELCHAFVHAQSSRLHQSAHSPHTNIVRHASEAMSAVMGGCGALSTLPYDAEFSEPSEFSERVARNVSLVLKHESYLDKVADPAAGAYYLEVLTMKLAEAAWQLFLEIEEEGGLVKAFEKNIIQTSIEHSWNKKLAQFQSGKVVVGVNKFQEKGEKSTLPERKLTPEVVSGRGYSFLKKKSLDESIQTAN